MGEVVVYLRGFGDASICTQGFEARGAAGFLHNCSYLLCQLPGWGQHQCIGALACTAPARISSDAQELKGTTT